MAFLETIDNDTVAALPAAHFPGRIVVVDKDSEIGAACEELRRHKMIGFDTETRPSFRAGVSYKVSLLQLSTPDTCYLFRLSRIRLDNRINTAHIKCYFDKVIKLMRKNRFILYI